MVLKHPPRSSRVAQVAKGRQASPGVACEAYGACGGCVLPPAAEPAGSDQHAHTRCRETRLLAKPIEGARAYISESGFQSLIMSSNSTVPRPSRARRCRDESQIVP